MLSFIDFNGRKAGLQRHKEMIVMKKIFGKEMIVFWISMTALICAGVSLNSSLEQLAKNGRDDDID